MTAPARSVTTRNRIRPEHIRAVVFDCDGVMFDTLEVNRLFYNRVMVHFGRPEINAEQLAYCHMHTVEESISRLLDRDTILIQEAHAFRRRLPPMEFFEKMIMEPDLRGLLSAIRESGRRTAVATNRSDSMDRLLEFHRLADQFDRVLISTDVPRPKPAPDQLCRILSDFGLRPDEMVYIGDSAVDSQAAAAAGVPFVAYGDPDMPANRHINALWEMRKILNLPAV